MKKNLLSSAIIAICLCCMVCMNLTGCLANEKTGATESKVTLTTEETHIKNAIGDYRRSLKNPDSLKLREDISYVEFENGTKYVFFKASGTNSYGASVTSMPILIDGEYYKDYEDINDRLDEITNSSSSDLTRDELEDLVIEKIELSFVKNIVKHVQSEDDMVGETYGTIKGEDSVCKKVEKISGEKIARALGCEWSEY